MEEKQSLAIVLDFCLALQAGEQEKLEQLGPKLAEKLNTVSGQQLLDALRKVLSTAIRKRRNDIFEQQLQAQEAALLEVLAKPEFQDTGREFVDFLVYTVVDRRLTEMRAITCKLVKAFTQNLSTTKLCGFWNEWTSLTARIVRRQWLSEAHWLERVMLEQLWQKRDLQLVQLVMWQLQMHLAMYCRVDGNEGVFHSYKPLFNSYLVIADYQNSGVLKNKELEGWLQTVLRSFRDIVTQLARSKMAEPADVYLELYALWQKSIEEPEADTTAPVWKRPASTTKRQELRIKRFLQMVITYWSLTNPKSSRRQVEYLQEIMEPRQITPECKALLKKLS